MSDGKRSFWSTVPGLITGLAGLLTGVVGLITLLVQQGVIGHDSSGSTSSSPSTTVTSTVTGATSGTITGGTGGGTGAATTGSFALSPDAVDFPATDPSPKSVMVRNTGSVALSGLQASVTGADADRFSVAMGDCTQSLVANLSCTLKVTFTPAPGAAFKKYSGTLQVTAPGATRGDSVGLTASTLL